MSYGYVQGFPGGSVIKNQPASAGDVGSITGLRRSPRERKGNPLQCSCLGNPMDGGAWWATVYAGGHKELDTTEHTHTHTPTRVLLYMHVYIYTCKHNVQVYIFQAK